MTDFAQNHPPGDEDRRHHTQDRQRVALIGAMWGALTLLALAVALLQPDDPAPAAAVQPEPALQAAAPGAPRASSSAALPNALPSAPSSNEPRPQL